MVRVQLETDRVRLPGWVVDLESFRRWSDDADFPETGQVSFLKGEVWIDMSKEQLFSHNDVKTEIASVLRQLVKAQRSGRYLGDGAFLSNMAADVSNQADGCFVSASSIQKAQVRIVEGRSHGHVELEGGPDMVLEVVSDSSVEKDTVVLRKAYAEAGIREYWLVDARGEAIQFAVLRLTSRGYVAARKRSGWVHSVVFKCWFQLTRQTGADNFPEYTLEHRAT
jgi:Uma2 family endonuclease